MTSSSILTLSILQIIDPFEELFFSVWMLITRSQPKELPWIFFRSLEKTDSYTPWWFCLRNLRNPRNSVKAQRAFITTSKPQNSRLTTRIMLNTSLVDTRLSYLYAVSALWSPIDAVRWNPPCCKSIQKWLCDDPKNESKLAAARRGMVSPGWSQR